MNTPKHTSVRRALRLTWILAIAAAALACNTAAGPGSETPVAAADAEDAPVTRPRFDPRGERIVAMAGSPGQRKIVVLNPDAPKERRFVTDGPGDDRDPVWWPDGSSVVFASNRGAEPTGYDLYRQTVDDDGNPVGQPERLTSLPGDEFEPAPSPIEFSFVAVQSDECSMDGTSEYPIDRYRKIAFTRRAAADAPSEVWFTTEDGVHLERVSAEASSAACSAPAWDRDGLGLVWHCAAEGTVTSVADAPARWAQDLSVALAALDADEETDGCSGWAFSYSEDAAPEEGARWHDDPCFEKLPRSYAAYESANPANAGAGPVRGATVSANRTQLVASTDSGEPSETELTIGSRRPRNDTDADVRWSALPHRGEAPANPVWSPDGTRVAYDAVLDGVRQVVVQNTDFYLQSVTNLADFPELYGAGESEGLAERHFVARAGEEREFHTLYDKALYAKRPVYVTADAVLQAYRDEFVRMLREAERNAAGAVLELTEVMLAHFAPRAASDASARYLAESFATAYVFLEAASRLKADQIDDPMEIVYLRDEDPDSLDEEDRATLAALDTPVAERFARYVTSVRSEVVVAYPDLADAVAANVSAALANEGLRDVVVPGLADPVKVDFSQMKPRGHYANNELIGYFYAMSWYAMVPMPMDDALLDVLEQMAPPPGAQTFPDAGAAWTRVDALVGAFMGRPVDPTLDHLRTLMADEPERFEGTRDWSAISKRLGELRGDIPLRGAEGALGGERQVAVTLFPKRLGYDVTLISKLTHPDVDLRGMPSALDVLGALGNETARDHALAAAEGEDYEAIYRKRLAELSGQDPLQSAYWSTDLYHGWLAMLLTLAEPLDLPKARRLHFAESAAWSDRLLTTQVAGYTQLKHSSVLYAMQEMGIQCGGDAQVMLLVEQPIVAPPEGFVEPMPAFFRQLSSLSDAAYQTLANKPPKAWSWHDEAPRNVSELADRLATIAQLQIDGKPLDDGQKAFVRTIGTTLETLYLGRGKSWDSFQIGNDTRLERGVAIATDIYTNLTRAQALHLGIGRIDDLYVVVPNSPHIDRGTPGYRLTQGGIYSVYEFPWPMAERLTDTEWNALLGTDREPERAPWSESYLEAEK